MTVLKTTISILIAGLSHNIYASSCLIDKNQMYAQIYQHASISTEGCPFNKQEVGIKIISSEKERAFQRCVAICAYAFGDGQYGLPCEWEKGNWGNTLLC